MGSQIGNLNFQSAMVLQFSTLAKKELITCNTVSPYKYMYFTCKALLSSRAVFMM